MIPGELVNLRAVERDDVQIIHRWLNNPTVMEGWGFGAAARSRQEVARDVDDWLAQERALGRPAALLAELVEDGAPVGLLILQTDRPEARSVELSLLVGDPACWGQGIGADMMDVALDASFGSWGIHRIGVRVEAGNERALALYRRLGFQGEGRLRQAAFRDGRHVDILLFSLLATEWAVHRGEAAS